VRRARGLLLRTSQVGLRGCLLLARTWWLLLAARMALRLIPVKKIVAWKQRPLPGRTSPADPAPHCARVRWAVLTAAHYSPLRFVCFPQCLAAAELLRSAAIPSRLHYGVKREGDKLVTHTWLEAAGEIVIGGEVADQFSTLDVY
jgi:hypothetical protein